MKKRFEVRRLVTRPMEIISSIWDEPIDFYTGDLSPRGTYVFSELMPDMGEHIICSFNLGSNLDFDFFGEIVRINMLRRKADENYYPGFGIQFTDAGPLDRLRMRNALCGTPPPVPTLRRIPTSGRRVGYPMVERRNTETRPSL